MKTYIRATMNSYNRLVSFLIVLLEVLYTWIYCLLSGYLIIFFFGLGKFNSPFMTIRCLKIKYLWLKIVKRLFYDKEILIIFVMIICALWVSSGCFRITYGYSQYWFRRLSRLYEKILVVLWIRGFRFIMDLCISLWFGITLDL